ADSVLAGRAGDRSAPGGGSMKRANALLEPVGDSTAAQVVGGEFDRDPVAFEDPDVVLPHPAGDVRQDLVAVLQLYTEVRVGQHLRDRTLHLDRVLRQAALLSAAEPLWNSWIRRCAIYRPDGRVPS